MRKNFIKVLPKEKCLAIAKIVNQDTSKETENELLCWLPDKIFGNEMVFTNLHGWFTVFDGECEWMIPPYFVEKAPVLII